MGVSIRARHACRAMRPSANAICASSRFQSAPGTRAGRCFCSDGCLRGDFQFQSAPGTRAGRCNMHDPDSFDLVDVSIRARHACRAMPHGHPTVRRGAEVSIRARHACRAMRTSSPASAPRTWFQSAPGTRAGRCPASSSFWSADSSFNPRPARVPGDAARPPTLPTTSTSFNPRPARVPGDAPASRKPPSPR